MTNVVVSNSFVTPMAQDVLNGELGLSLYDVANSLGAEFKIVKRKLLERGMLERIKAQNFTAVPVGTTVNSGSYGEREIESFILDVNAAKFFVAKYDNEIGDAYLAYLIRLEEQFLKTKEIYTTFLETNLKKTTRLLENTKDDVRELKNNLGEGDKWVTSSVAAERFPVLQEFPPTVLGSTLKRFSKANGFEVRSLAHSVYGSLNVYSTDAIELFIAGGCC